MGLPTGCSGSATGVEHQVLHARLAERVDRRALGARAIGSAERHRQVQEGESGAVRGTRERVGVVQIRRDRLSAPVSELLRRAAGRIAGHRPHPGRRRRAAVRQRIDREPAR